jgi:hypothetical protein
MSIGNDPKAALSAYNQYEDFYQRRINEEDALLMAELFGSITHPDIVRKFTDGDKDEQLAIIDYDITNATHLNDQCRRALRQAALTKVLYERFVSKIQCEKNNNQQKTGNK